MKINELEEAVSTPWRRGRPNAFNAANAQVPAEPEAPNNPGAFKGTAAAFLNGAGLSNAPGASAFNPDDKIKPQKTAQNRAGTGSPAQPGTAQTPTAQTPVTPDPLADEFSKSWTAFKATNPTQQQLSAIKPLISAALRRMKTKLSENKKKSRQSARALRESELLEADLSTEQIIQIFAEVEKETQGGVDPGSEDKDPNSATTVNSGYINQQRALTESQIGLIFYKIELRERAIALLKKKQLDEGFYDVLKQGETAVNKGAVAADLKKAWDRSSLPANTESMLHFLTQQKVDPDLAKSVIEKVSPTPATQPAAGNSQPNIFADPKQLQKFLDTAQPSRALFDALKDVWKAMGGQPVAAQPAAQPAAALEPIIFPNSNGKPEKILPTDPRYASIAARIKAESANKSGKALTEGGHVFDNTTSIKKEDVPDMIKTIKNLMPRGVRVIPDIGSAGYKTESGDMDVFIDVNDLLGPNIKDEKEAKVALKVFLEKKGYKCALSGRNVHVRMPVAGGDFVQVDLMIIPNANKVAPFHQHGPSGQYNDPAFKGAQLFILYSSIAKALGLKFSPFEGKLIDRVTNKVVADDKDSVAKILLNRNASAADLANVKTILQALANDPKKDLKLAQAKEDAKKGLIVL